MTASEVLLKAADYLEEHGWYQGGFSPSWKVGDTHPPCCAGGAINMIVNGQPDNLNGSFEAMNLFRGYLKTDYMTAWNDNRYRTKEEVINALREAAR